MCFTLVENALIDQGVQQQAMINSEKVASYLQMVRATESSKLDEPANIENDHTVLPKE